MLRYPRPWQVLCTTTKIQRAQSCPSILDEESLWTAAPEAPESTRLEKGPRTSGEPVDTKAPDEMDRITRYPIFSIPHSPKVSGLPTDPDSYYTFDVVKVESLSPNWDKDSHGVNAGGQSFRFRPEETSGLRVVTVTQETVPMPHLVKESQHILTENHSVNRWTPSWERKSQAEVVKTGPTYSLRAYPEERHPGKLYSGEEEEEELQLYRLGPGENAFPKRKKDLEREREAVIRGQAVKRSSTVATRWSSQEELDRIYSGQGPSSISASDSENVVDTDQINFLAARQQFMNLEKLTTNSQPPQKPTGRTVQTMRVSPEGGRANVGQSTRSYGSSRVGLTNGYTVSIKAQGKEDAEGARPGWSGLALTSHRSSMSQLSFPSVDDAQAQGFGEVSPELVPPDEGPKETPIEREIRRAQEREADLRQQRGLQRSGSRDELVEVPSRPLLSKVNLIFAPTPKKGKDTGRPSSLYIQREIALDTKREADHRREAARSDVASRASTPNQMAKDSELPKGAPKMRRAQSSDSILSLTSDAHPVETTLEGRKISRIPLDAYQPYLTPDDTKKEFQSYFSYKPGSSLASGHHTMGSRREEGVAIPPPFSQKASWGGEQVREKAWKSQASTVQRQEPWRSSPQESTHKAWDDQKQGLVLRDYFHLRPMKFKLTSSPGQEEASVHQQKQVWESKGHVEEVAIPTKPHRSQSSSLLDMEIQSVLQRERELQEERRNALFPEVFSPTPQLDQSFEWGAPDSRHSSVSSGITGSYTVSETPTFSPVRLHSGLVWKVTDQSPRQEEFPWKMKRDTGYAGLDISDTVNTEIVEATRVSRHKNAMATRWEAQMYASEDED
ncbi:mitotic interactor and substrate of PLK1 [Dromiciops gliroides]|uniref:mitotic interactor and substrate of PLK1 n=1 Tax=Dromiciops gliroides TaxID=33562 RepID=UPI001CC5F068|nr:mitotic interactor and substrate of PLK1 [Dromiciops gliroides]